MAAWPVKHTCYWLGCVQRLVWNDAVSNSPLCCSASLRKNTEIHRIHLAQQKQRCCNTKLQRINIPCNTTKYLGFALLNNRQDLHCTTGISETEPRYNTLGQGNKDAILQAGLVKELDLKRSCSRTVCSARTTRY